MHITIQFDSTDKGDNAVLGKIFATHPTVATEVTTVTGPETPAPAPKAAPKAKATPKPEPTPEPVEEDLLGGEEEVDYRKAAIDRATELVSNGGSATVRKALDALGAKRVSDLSGDQFQAFLESVKPIA